MLRIHPKGNDRGTIWVVLHRGASCVANVCEENDNSDGEESDKSDEKA